MKKIKIFAFILALVFTSIAARAQCDIAQQLTSGVVVSDVASYSGGAWYVGPNGATELSTGFTVPLPSGNVQNPRIAHGLGTVWLVAGNTLYYLNNNQWVIVQTPNSRGAYDVGGVDGAVWIIDGNSARGGFAPAFTSNFPPYAGNPFSEVGGGGLKVSADNNHLGWVVNASNEIWHWGPSSWVRYPGSGFDISATDANHIFVLGTFPSHGSVYFFNGTSWAYSHTVQNAGIVGTAISFSGATSGLCNKAYFVDQNHNLWSILM